MKTKPNNPAPTNWLRKMKCLQQAGYKTGVVGKWHNFPKDASFQQAFILPHNPALADYQKPGAAEVLRANHEEALRILRNGYGWDYVDRINIGNSVFNLEWMIEGALEFIVTAQEPGASAVGAQRPGAEGIGGGS